MGTPRIVILSEYAKSMASLLHRATSFRENGLISPFYFAPSLIIKAQSKIMIIDWFDVTNVVAFAEEVVLEVNRLLLLVQQQDKIHADKKEQKRFDALIARVNAYARKNSLNIYKKAKFLNTVKWRLQDAGHEKKLIDEMIALLTASLNV